MWHFLATAAETAANDAAEFEGRARTFFMWMAIFALVVTWLWLYLRIRQRMTEPRPTPPEETQPAEKSPD
jgi:hypothetical protein